MTANRSPKTPKTPITPKTPNSYGFTIVHNQTNNRIGLKKLDEAGVSNLYSIPMNQKDTEGKPVSVQTTDGITGLIAIKKAIQETLKDKQVESVTFYGEFNACASTRNLGTLPYILSSSVELGINTRIHSVHGTGDSTPTAVTTWKEGEEQHGLVVMTSDEACGYLKSDPTYFITLAKRCPPISPQEDKDIPAAIIVPNIEKPSLGKRTSSASTSTSLMNQSLQLPSDAPAAGATLTATVPGKLVISIDDEKSSIHNLSSRDSNQSSNDRSQVELVSPENRSDTDNAASTPEIQKAVTNFGMRGSR